MEEIRWGIIGSGDVAEHKGGPALCQVAGSRLVAVMSQRAERARAFADRHGAERYYDALEDLMQDDEVDAVYIATPPNIHATLTIRVAEARKHVLCEKPMAMTVAECRAMIQACRKHGVQLMVAYYRRFFPVVQKMQALVEEGAIGRLLRARAAVASYYEPRTDGERAWLTEPGVAGGGFLTDVGTHRLDLMTHFLGDVQGVFAFIDTQHPAFPVDDASTLIMRFVGDTHASAAFNWNTRVPIDEFEVCGTEGRLFARDLGAGVLEHIHPGRTESYLLPAPPITHLGLVGHYVECLRRGVPNALPGEAGMQATRITEAAYQSAREGKPVSLA